MKAEKFSLNAISRYRTEIMGFMCILIVLFHYKNNMIHPPALSAVDRLFEFGNVGVDVFLFVSGIGLYFSFQKSKHLLTFYKKRLIRIILPYVLLCVPYYIWLNLATERDLLLLDITQISLPLKGMISTWYLPAITVFYLLFPLIYKLQQQKSDTRRVLVTAIACICWTAVLIVMSKVSSEIYHNCEIALTRLIIFMVGCCFGKFVYDGKKLPWSFVALGAVYILIYPFLYHKLGFTIFKERLTYVPLAMAIAFVLAFVFSWLKDNNVIFKVLRFFGERSLEIYITHVLINNVWAKTVGARHFDQYGMLDYAIIVMLALFLSVISHVIIEKIAKLLLK